MRLFIGRAEECDKKGAQEIINLIKDKPNCVLGLATGSTPIGMYRLLIESYRAGQTSFSKVTTYNLDEYVGLPKDHHGSYYYFMQKHLFQDIDIPAENVSIPDGNAPDLEQECRSYEERIEKSGGIDLQVLGIGHNGHIGFNEPGTPFGSVTQLFHLTERTIQANARFFDKKDQMPRQALSMGIKTIMLTRKILFFAKGADKADIIQKTLQGPVTPDVPASILQLHPNLHVFVDYTAAAKL